MTDFEDRLSTALRSAGDDAPDAAGLAPAARSRARARSRRTALASAAAVVAVAGVVGGVALLGDRDGGRAVTPATDGATQTASSDPDTPVASTRLESWRDLSVQVPSSWGYGNLSTWCLADGPVVERPGGVVRTIGCGGPNEGYGVRFLDGSAISLAYPPGHIWRYDTGDVEMYPAGSWLGYEKGSGDNLVWVVAKERSTVEQVLGSFVRNAELDPLGCAPRGGEGAAVAQGDLRLCRYSMDGWLEQSELLSGQEAADADAALQGGPPSGGGLCTMEISGPTVQITSSATEGLLTLNACQGYTWDGVPHALTADVLYWALSPGWSGAVDGDVPLPDQLRK